MKPRSIVVALVLLGLAAAGAAAFIKYRGTNATSALPSAPARRGEFLVIVKCRGELRARRSVQVTAPMNVPDLRIVWLAPPNSAVKEGDVVVRFDQSSAKQILQEKEAALKQAEETLNQAIAEARITAESDRRDLATATYEVERARLEVSRVEILSAIQGEEARINLGLADRKLKVQQATVQLHEASSRSKTASLTRLRDQAVYEVNLTRERLSKMEVRSPLSGVIVFMPNYSQGWMNAKPFKVGDQVWPGGSIATIPDLLSLEMEGKVEEIDRGRIALGNDVRIRVDALPELSVPAKLTDLSVMTQVSFDWPPSYSFRAYAAIPQPDGRLRPEMNASMDIVIDRLSDAISVPAKALFTRQGKPMVYLASSGSYQAHFVEVVARNPDEVAVKGLNAGATVALVEPDSQSPSAARGGKQ
ncbi:MAG: HlyD family efflux transporter periplasmic adaptor subunit [Acidobacteria bacterium]|nr:HlyD family efflux transporter periplasmic adaptor subunit [Acidobacteriota bacterium]